VTSKSQRTIPTALTWAYVRSEHSGDEGTRTLNPRRAKAVLYQVELRPRSQAPRASRGALDAGRGRLTPKVGLCLGRTLTLHEDKCNQTDEQQHDHLFHDGSPPCQDGDSPVGLAGLEPATSSLSGMRSNRLSYRPPHDAARLPHRLHRSQLAYTPGQRQLTSVRLGQGDLDPADEVRSNVVDE
jgi:hypothetical protein